MVTFYKYHGTGNDFVIMDNRKGEIPDLTTEKVKLFCHRRFGIGGDGLLIMKEKQGYDFEMIYYNADGNLGSMCGNGGRCMIKFASDRGIHKYTYKFFAADGEHEGEIDTNGIVRLKMQDVNKVDDYNSYCILNTGSPHYIKFMNDIKQLNVVAQGRDIRYQEEFANEGINVNFVESMENDQIFVRTYERGVEDETFSCGTGVTAAALVSAHNYRGFNRVTVKTPGGTLNVEFNKTGDDSFEDIWLCGHAEFVFKGETELI